MSESPDGKTRMLGQKNGRIQFIDPVTHKRKFQYTQNEISADLIDYTQVSLSGHILGKGETLDEAAKDLIKNLQKLKFYNSQIIEISQQSLRETHIFYAFITRSDGKMNTDLVTEESLQYFKVGINKEMQDQGFLKRAIIDLDAQLSFSSLHKDYPKCKNPRLD